MKKCPQCRRVYSDDTLNFCLEDGTVLETDTAADTDESISRKTEQQTEILSEEKVSGAVPKVKIPVEEPDKGSGEEKTHVRSSPPDETSGEKREPTGVSPVFAYLTVGLLALLVLFAGIALFYWINWYNPQPPDSADEVTKNLTNSNETGKTDLNLNVSPVETSSKSPPETPLKTKTPAATPENETEKPPPPEATPEATGTPEKETGRYFVVLGSFPPAQKARAAIRLQQARNRGLDARIIDTSNFPGLRSGLLAVVMGPYSKSEAQNALARAKSVTGDAYVKAGK